jgi:hypothetical protein
VAEEDNMTRNIKTAERVVRVVIGVMILGLYGALDPPWQYLTLIGLAPLGTGLTGFCPMYARVRPPPSRPTG